MKSISRLFGYGLVLVLLVTALPVFAAGGGQAASSGSGAALKDIDRSKEVEVIMYYTGDKKPRADELFTNVSNLIKSKINTTLKINMLPTASYRQTYPLLFASGEAFDLAYAATWLNFADLAKRGSFMAIEQLAPKYAPKLYARESESAKKQATLDGHLYGLPSLWATYSAYGPVYRTDLVKNSGWNGKMDNFADLEVYLDLVKKNAPNVEPYMVYSGTGSEGDDVFLYTNGIYPIKGSTGDFLFMDPKDPNPKLFTFYEYPKTMEYLTMMKRWNDNGYFPKSALADPDGDKVRNGKAATRFHNIDTYEGYYREKPDWEFKWSNFVSDVSNLSWTQDTCVVASSSKNPDRALDLYDLIMSDEQVFRAFVYGIEGVTYRIQNVNGQNYVQSIQPAVPELYDFTRMWCARTPEFYLPTYGAPADLNVWKGKFNAYIKEGVMSQKYRSFVPDFTSVEAENAACLNAHMQYWWPLELAYVDINTGLKEYEAAMKAAGIDKVRAALQTQLDAYIRDYK